MKSADNSGSVAIVVIAVLVILAGLAIFFKDQLKNLFSSLTGGKSTNQSSNANSTVGTSGNSSTATNIPASELTTSSGNYIASNPHMKGIWKSGSQTWFEDLLTKKKYVKSGFAEILGANVKYNVYHIRYQSNICWVPTSILAEDGAFLSIKA